MITEAHVGFKRLQELLELRDYVHPSNRKVSSDSDTSIELKNANLAWEVMNIKEKSKTKVDKKKNKKDEKTEKEELDSTAFVPCLFDLDLNIRKGQLIGVAGGVGSGKTSLISAVMGEVWGMSRA